MAKKNVSVNQGTGGAFYGLGLIGAWVFYIKAAAGFGGIVLALLKGLVWPAFFVYDVLKFVT